MSDSRSNPFIIFLRGNGEDIVICSIFIRDNHFYRETATIRKNDTAIPIFFCSYDGLKVAFVHGHLTLNVGSHKI